ncbi:hypothetical protein PGT21_006872 [Puccinia graminis f. sp. tritici]|uniref:Uncharacterized protein n=1 Tax=Puccinia graminis f. sp. tritici TaxID=56615 RepID=A0A5B0NQB5_PUCGR|nr:hypothetical protein PGT21_006872 [Puccinia graminis f. sp. tritici]KAA1090300.1 hypothetical protein PGTUg99_003232 [Puccinia graminis f. sp. tritici]
MCSFRDSAMMHLCKRVLLGGLITFPWMGTIFADEGHQQLSFLPNAPQTESSPSPGADHPNLIFASFAGLLQQWPNTYAYSGHSIIPGVIRTGTLLYHGTNHHTPPPSEGMKWFAFDPEYSYVIHSRRLGQLDLYTYAVTRPLRIIYLDGQSASLGTPGFMDSQSVLINGTILGELGDEGNYMDEEYDRARELCKIGKDWGFEGVVRMNTCFELLWCDLTQGVELLGGTNTTDPFDTYYEPGDFHESKKVIETHSPDTRTNSSAPFVQNPLDVINPLCPNGVQKDFEQKIEVCGASASTIQLKNNSGSIKSDGPNEALLQIVRRTRVINSPFYLRAPQYYLRAASRKFGFPGEVRVSLDPSGFVSFYDRIESLSQKRQADGTDIGPRHAHTLQGISSSDVKKIKDRLLNVLARKNAEGWRTESDRLDWRTAVETVVQTYSRPLIELDYLLKRDDMSAIDRAAEVRGLTYGMILPYLDFSTWNIDDPAWIDGSLEKCARGFTAGTYRASDLTESIEVIIGAIEGTLSRLCSTIFSIFSQTIQLAIPIDSLISPDSRLESEANSRTLEWRKQTDELMMWLGWSTWGQCNPPCKPDEICLPPLWPIFWIKGFPKMEEFPICSNVSGKRS